uniref:Uncharacterized protein n=1 Tax=Oryza sativa subsp. japonica TaxID=39947 RepID=Q75GP3_ORYSJ|nr:hypothetical protein [Oryza sativa Japonica Group]
MSMLPPNSSSLPLVAAMYNPPRPSSSPLLPNRLDPRVWKMNIFICGQPNQTRQRAEEKLIAVAVASPPTAASCVGCRLAWPSPRAPLAACRSFAEQRAAAAAALSAARPAPAAATASPPPAAATPLRQQPPRLADGAAAAAFSRRAATPSRGGGEGEQPPPPGPPPLLTEEGRGRRS